MPESRMNNRRSDFVRLVPAHLASAFAIAFLALAALPSAVRAEASLLVTSTATAIGAKAASSLAVSPGTGLGIFASRWDSRDHGTLDGYGVRMGWNVFQYLGMEARASYFTSKSEIRKTTVIPLEGALTLRVPVGQHLAPYVGGGVGYYMMEAKYRGTEPRNLSDEVAGYFALAGLNVRLGAATLFGEAKYTLVGTDDDLEWRGADVEQRNSLDGLSWTIGLKLGF